MSKIKFLLTFLICVILLNYPIDGQTKILIVTGGKNFESESFYEIFKSFNDVEVDTASKTSFYNSNFRDGVLKGCSEIALHQHK